jgi:hypothetical protein
LCLNVGRLARQLYRDHLGGHEIKVESSVLEIARVEELMSSDLSYKVSHITGHRVALFLRLESGTVLEAQEHLLNLILSRVLNDTYV